MDERLVIFHRVLAIAGIPIYAKKNWNSKIWLSFQIFNFILGVFCFIFTTGFVALNSGDLVVFIQGACIWTTGVIMTLTLGICLLFRNKFRVFLEEMAFKDEMLSMPLVAYVNHLKGGKKLYELKIMVNRTQDELMNFTVKLLKVYLGSVCSVATLYLCSPIYEMFVKKDPSLRLLAFDMWLPWSLEDLRVYVISFIYHAHAGYLCCIAYPGLQVTIVLLIGQIIRQLRILRFILSNLNELISELVQNRYDTWQDGCTAVFCQCIDHYIKLKSFSKRLNVICCPFYLTLILVAIMLVCMCSVKIAISDKLSPDTIKYYTHEICFILVVMMFCLLGQQVDNECEKLEERVTDNWFMYDKNHKMNIKIFKMALDQRMPIHIFGSIPLSLPTYTWFIKTGMSFFTLVMSVLEN